MRSICGASPHNPPCAGDLIGAIAMTEPQADGDLQGIRSTRAPRLHAHDRDYQVFVLADASADPRSDVHDFLIEKIFPRQAHVITTAELPAALSAR